jgi:zinc protease
MSESLNIACNKKTLNNGLEVILFNDKSLPIVSVNIWYRVGSANEVKGKTGFAHLFEHMMFQGSENVQKEMHFRYIQEAGGTLNGSTSIDRTNYYETVPSNNLDLALWLESDRMGFMLEGLTQEKLDNQKDVVMNERRQRYDNPPYGLAWELIFSNLFDESFPYHWPTIGWMKDIESYELDDVKNFFKTYYSPNNASLVIAGNFDESNILERVNKYFGDIPSSNNIPDINPTLIPLAESKKIIHHDNIQLPRLYLAWQTDKMFGKDDAALDILSEILGSNKNSRLYKSLVHEKQIAQDVSCFQYSAKFCGMFFIIVTAKPGIDLNEIYDEISTELEKLKVNGITKAEMIRTRNSIKSTFIYSLQNIERIADQLNMYNFALNEPNSFQKDLSRYEIITEENVKRIADKYLSENKVQLHIVPKEITNE